MLRSLAAIFAGLVTTMLLLVVTNMAATTLMRVNFADPSIGYLVANLLLTTASAGAGGALTARMAKAQAFQHVLLLAVLLLLLGFAGYSEAAQGRPFWHPLMILFLGPVGVLLGGALAGSRTSDPSAG